jgi:hypothetical protein
VQTVTKIVCDFCDAETREAWFFWHEKFRFHGPGQEVIVDAGEVAVCPECRPLVDQRNAAALIVRTCAVSPDMIPARGAVHAYQSRVLEHLGARPPRLVQLGDTRPPHDRFLEIACGRCGTKIRFDRLEAVDQMVKRNCPNCSTENRIGPFGFRRREPVR